jgi:RNA 2',3'-cyclic 3'-phosphodiesterase
VSEFVRAFLAFELENPQVRQNLTHVQEQALKTGADLKLVEPENIHITMRFLGDITLKMVDQVFGEMQKIQFKPFPVHIYGLGVFPSLGNPRVLWAGIMEGAVQLKNVFEQLEPKIQGLGFQPDPKGFSPHLTIARVRSDVGKAQLAEFVQKNGKFEFGTVNAASLRLKRSELTPKGPIYSTLKEYYPKA